MKPNILFKSWFLFFVLVGLLFQPVRGTAARPAPRAQAAGEVTAYDLIVAMNSLRVSNGLPALVEDAVIDAVAQSTAQIMADNQMSAHIGNVSGRLAGAGYGGGATVWGTENFAVGNQSIDEIMLVWSDAAHMLPATTAAYCNVGAGIAKSANGMTYYILQAAYTSGKSCGEYTSTGTTTSKSGGTTGSAGVSQLVAPVKIATPDADGKVFHLVQPGQSFWSIAIAYKITIRDLKSWNNLSDVSILKTGQKLFIPGSNTAGYATPTQPGAIQLGTPDAAGRITHVVQSYQTLSTIAQAYGTTIEKLLALNALQADWPLQIGQKLLVDSGNITPSPTLLPVQLLTPASDGNYYHSVRSGETLSWIAGLYQLRVSDLMAWNGLSSDSILRIDEKLLLMVTPPATPTHTPVPPSLTATPALVLTATPSAPALASPSNPGGDNTAAVWAGALGLAAVALGLAVFLLSRKNKK